MGDRLETTCLFGAHSLECLPLHPRTPVPERRVFEGVQALRALAALAIVLLHVFNEAGAYVGHQGVSPYGWTSLIPFGAGVDLFFVISGFVMAWTCWNEWGQPGAVARFARKRLLRIVPLYWLLTLATVAIALSHPDRVSEGLRDGWSYVVASLAFLPWTRADGSIQPLLRVGWTLNYEMEFYVLLGLSVLVRRTVALPCLLAVLVSLTLLHETPTAASTALDYWTNPVILEFGLGLLVGIAARLRWRGGWVAWLAALAAVVLASIAPPNTSHTLDVGIPAALIVFAALSIERLPAWLVLLGDASYALYLVHPFPMRAVDLAFQRLGLPIPFYIVAATALSIATAICLHLWVERPILRLGARPRPVAAR